MKRYIPFITLTLLALAFAGCSTLKKDSVADLGVIELAPNVPKHIKVGDANWTITETRDASGKQKIFAESDGRKATQKDIANSSAPPDAEIGSTLKEVLDLTGLPTGVEYTGYFGGKPVRFTLKPQGGISESQAKTICMQFIYRSGYTNQPKLFMEKATDKYCIYRFMDGGVVVPGMVHVDRETSRAVFKK